MNKFKIETRDIGIKPAYMRKNGIVPGSIYGKTINSTPVKATFNELQRVTSKTGEVYQVEFEGKSYNAKLFEVQKNPVTGQYVHFSLVELPKGETNDLDVPLVTTGTAKGENDGGTIVVLNDYITLNGLIKDMPKELKIDVSELSIGDKVTVADLKLGSKLTTSLNEDEAIVVCRPPATVAEAEPDLTENEPEVINQEGSDTNK